jgi:quinoprotein dehydrogenase-associated probable ABC transporter substrate-binding protein
MMYKRLFAAAIMFFACIPAARAQTAASSVDTTQLRVCADPANLPFSNTKGEGFENKIADLLGKELGVPVTYAWYPMATGFVRNTLWAGKCDVILGFAQGDDIVQNTNAYYRSAWSIVFKPGNGLDGLTSLDDPRLKDKRIGLIANAPPGEVMIENGLMVKARFYHLVVDRRFESPSEEMVKDIMSGEVDAGILWGPIAGYFGRQTDPKLVIVPLVKETKGPKEAFRITFGVRKHDQEWKRQLNTLIEKNQGKINEILMSFGVPLLDEQDQALSR